MLMTVVAGRRATGSAAERAVAPTIALPVRLEIGCMGAACGGSPAGALKTGGRHIAARR
jgi:hypothetical protein